MGYRMRHAKHLLIVGTNTQYGRRNLEGVHAYCRTHGNWEFHVEEEVMHLRTVKRLQHALFKWKADGIIMHLRSRNVEKLLQSSGLPIVNFGAALRSDLPTVIADNVAVGRMVARHFLENGFRNFAFVSKTSEDYTHKRCEGFVQEIAAAGFDCDVFTDKCVGDDEPDWFENRQRMSRRLLLLKKPVAIMCIYDLRSHEVASACRQLGLRVPEDVAIVGVDNDDILCRMSTPPLSSVGLDNERIGYEAARLLDRMIRGAKTPSEPVLIPPRRLVIRHSSDVIAIDDPEISATMRFIREHADKPINVKDLLRHVPVSRSSMEMRFERLFGRTPSAAITCVHMELAKNLLAETNLSIGAVARNSGYTNQEIFSVSFRRELGLTPTQYRQKSRMDGTTARDYQHQRA